MRSGITMTSSGLSKPVNSWQQTLLALPVTAQQLASSISRKLDLALPQLPALELPQQDQVSLDLAILMSIQVAQRVDVLSQPEPGLLQGPVLQLQPLQAVSATLDTGSLL